MDRSKYKKGVAIVFVTITLSSMVFLTLMFITYSKAIADNAFYKAHIHLASRSVLSEYNIPLKERYSIFSFNLKREDLTQRMKYYLNENVNKGILLGGEVKSVTLNLDDYYLFDPDILEYQILKAAEYDFADRKVPQDYEFNKENANLHGFAALPSKTAINKSITIDSLISLLKNPKALVLQGTAKHLRLKYLKSYFNNYRREEGIPETYFNYELEYILYGRVTDYGNLDKFKSDFILMRTALNLAHIISDKEKIASLEVLANTLTPGPEAEVTKAVLASIWARLEAGNDWKMVSKDKGVEPIKSKEDWAVSLKSIFKQSSEEGYVKPKRESDFTYEDYLTVFLAVQNRNTQLLRTMDLMELNICCYEGPDFSIKDCCTGFSYFIWLGGKSFEGKEIY